MKPSPQGDVRSAIIAALRQAGLPGDARIREAVVPAYSKDQLATTVISVVTAGVATERVSRKRVRIDTLTDIAIQRAVPTVATADGYQDLDVHSTQALDRMLMEVARAAWAAPGTTGVETLAAPDRDHAASGIWTGVLRVRTFGEEMEA